MTENAELAVYGAIAVWVGKEMLLPLVKGSFARNVQARDDAEKAQQKKLDEHELRLNDLEKTQGQVQIKMDASSSSIASELNGIRTSIGHLDTRIEKSGKSHEERLEKGLADVTTELNRKLTGVLNSELERTVREVLREELSRREGRAERP
jgi:archaellum component FlaC